MLTEAEIVGLYDQRSREYETTTAGMTRVKTVYEGELRVNLPDMDDFTVPPVPNLLAQGVDQMAGRIASTTPEIIVVPRRASRTEERRASTARRVLGSWWAADRLPLKMETRSRHLTAYGATTTVLA